jgi:ribose transport system permease protein
VTLGALSIYRGIGLKLINGSPVPFTNPLISSLAIGQAVPSVGNVALWAIAAWLAAWFVCFRTRFGLYIYAIGGSERVALLAGIAVDRWKTVAFALSGATAALAGLFSVGQLGSADPTLGSSFLLDSLAAIVVGGTSLSGGIGGVQRTLLGVLVIAILDDGLNLRGVDEFTQEIIKGFVVVAAATIVMVNRRKALVK